jgi:hypothetical protein
LAVSLSAAALLTCCTLLIPITTTGTHDPPQNTHTHTNTTDPEDNDHQFSKTLQNCSQNFSSESKVQCSSS